jgi:small subunit ribosomal protein S15
VPKKEKGQSHSTRPLSRRSPSWCRYTSEEVEALVVRLAREGNPSSKIGVILRDQYGIPMVKAISGKGIIEILKDNNLGPAVPEDLEALLRKAARLHTHLNRNKSDKYNKQAIHTVESRIRSLAAYYRRIGVLPEDWKYTTTALAVA